MKRKYMFIVDDEKARKLGTWCMLVGVKIDEIKEIIVEDKLRWMFIVRMSIIDRLMYKIDKQKGEII